MSQRANFSVSILAITAAIALQPVAAAAQDNTSAQNAAPASDNTEIIVTAQRRAERSVDVPITVTTLGSEALETANARNLVDISKVTPSLRFDAASGFVQPTIRGIGTAVVTSGGGANVGLYIDGFYSPNPLAANAQLMNVQSVQVLKGPQGTLFGRNTTGGAILIQTAEPSENTGGQFKLSYGRFNDASVQFYATTGIAPGIAFDVEGSYRHGDGFQRNIIDNDKRIGEYRSYSVRTGLKFNIGDSGSLLLRYAHSDIDDPRPVLSNVYIDPVMGVTASHLAPAGTYTTKPNEVARNLPGLFRSKSDTIQATLKFDLGFADFTSYSQYRTEDVDQAQDLDSSSIPIFQIGLPVKNKTISQEFLLNSKAGTPLQWTAGLFYFTNEDTFWTFLDNYGNDRNLLGSNRLGGSGTKTESYAAFLDATYELTPQLFITGGVRYSHDSVKDAYYNIGATVEDVSSIKRDKITPRFVVRFKPSDQSSIYASFTQGYKAALIDVGGSCQLPTAYICNNVKPEKINAYEVGAKFDNRIVSLEAAAFYYDYKNLQISSYLDSGFANITNAAASEIYGVEGSARIHVSDAFEISAGASWTHARYKRFDNAPVYVPMPPCTDPDPQNCPIYSFAIPAGTTIVDGTMQRTPSFTGNIGASYQTPLAGGDLRLSANLYYTSKFYFGPSGSQFPQKGYEVASARAQWTDPSGAYTLAIWGDNLTNSRYRTGVAYNSFSIGSTWNSPTTYGVELGFKF